MKKKNQATVHGAVFLENENSSLLSSEQIALLGAIDEAGSISGAAKVLGISYKTAWDRVDALNNLSEQPLVSRVSGGARGGGTRLTPHARKLMEGFGELSAEHEAFIRRIGGKLQSFNDLAGFIRTSGVSTSARNQYLCRIESITRGKVNADVALRCGESLLMHAQITMESLKSMKLKRGGRVIALIKSSWVLLSDDENLRSSAGNRLPGSVARIVRGAVNDEVIVQLEDDKSICAIIPRETGGNGALKVGQHVGVHFNASSVILIQT